MGDEVGVGGDAIVGEAIPGREADDFTVGGEEGESVGQDGGAGVVEGDVEDGGALAACGDFGEDAGVVAFGGSGQ